MPVSKQLLASWKQAKTISETLPQETINFILAMEASVTGYVFCKQQMQALDLPGEPYIDCRTFKAWKEAGYSVNKGEHSKIDGLTWIVSKKKTKDEKEEETTAYPKTYKLFHISQVHELEPEAIETI